MYDLEVEPLSVAPSVQVIFKPEIVLNIVNFYSSPQVTIFEPTIEY